jgi:hypothetical protein
MPPSRCDGGRVAFVPSYAPWRRNIHHIIYAFVIKTNTSQLNLCCIFAHVMAILEAIQRD